MARGWESKQVEEQMASAGEASGSAAGLVSEEGKRRRQEQRAEVQRKRRGLVLMRENILSQKTNSPERRQALQAALASIEAEIGRLGV
jgi:hypothetical protein